MASRGWCGGALPDTGGRGGGIRGRDGGSGLRTGGVRMNVRREGWGVTIGPSRTTQLIPQEFMV